MGLVGYAEKPISIKESNSGEKGKRQVVMNVSQQDWASLVRELNIESAMIAV